MRHTDVIEQVSKEFNVPKKVIDFAYRSYWLFIKKTIAELPLRDDLNEEEFSKLRTCFVIPAFGRLVCTYKRMKKVNEKRRHYAKYYIKEDKQDDKS